MSFAFFHNVVSQCSSETCWHPEGRGSWSVAFLLPGSVPPAGATQTAEIHNHLPALQTVWPSPRATTPPLFAHQRDLHRRQRISRGCVRPLNPLPTQPPTPNPSTLVRIRNFTQGQSAQQMNACRLNLCANGLNIHTNSLARWQYISAGVYLIAAFCLILRYLWVLHSDRRHQRVCRSPSHLLQESSDWLYLEWTTFEGKCHSAFI